MPYDDKQHTNSGEAAAFDSLARGLASGSVSRGKALRWMGAMLAGTVVASVPGITLTQRAAEAAPKACEDASACCACTYRNATTGEVIGGTCSTEVGHRCEGRRFRAFQAQCRETCEANAPAGANVSTEFACEEVSGLEHVCRQRESGARRCGQRSC
jgi:hypothetical protein